MYQTYELLQLFHKYSTTHENVNHIIIEFEHIPPKITLLSMVLELVIGIIRKGIKSTI